MRELDRRDGMVGRFTDAITSCKAIRKRLGEASVVMDDTGDIRAIVSTQISLTCLLLAFGGLRITR